MANHKSAEKRARQTKRRTIRNARVKSAVRTVEKKATAAKGKEAPEMLKKFMSEAMKAVSKGVLNKKTAARKIARLSSALSSK